MIVWTSLLALFAQSFPSGPIVTQEEQAEAAQHVANEFFSQDEFPSFRFRGEGREQAAFSTPFRASDEPGICVSERLDIIRWPGADGEATQFELELETYFGLPMDPEGEPIWRLSGDALDSGCQRPFNGFNFFQAEDAEAATLAVLSHLKLKQALTADPSDMIECVSQRYCKGFESERQGIAALIEPFEPNFTAHGGYFCRDEARCITFNLNTPEPCIHWMVTGIYADDEETFLKFRFHQLWDSLGCDTPSPDEDF